MLYSDIRHITVLGAGTMGAAITQFWAAKGFQVSLYSRTGKTLEKALSMIGSNPSMLSGLGVDSGDRPDIILGRIRTFTDIEEASADADWIIESVAEKPEIKKQVMELADRAAPKYAYLTSDTSALNIFDFLETNRADRVLITHFFNPASLMPLVEMVPGPETSETAVANLKAFLEENGKQPIVLKECIPGFIANRLTLALAREAFYLAGKGYASIEDIDRVITSTFGPRYVFEGIFDLYDHIGLDVGSAVAKDLLPQLCSCTEVPELLREKAEAGELGVKTGKGLKDYTGKKLDDICRERNEKIAKTFRYMKGL